MLVPELLLETMEDLLDKDLEMLKWYLSLKILDGCKPIPKSCLEKASRQDTVSKMTERYGEESAVNITVEILRKMNFNAAAEELKSKYAGAVDVRSQGLKPATPTTSSSAVAPPAAPAATISAQQGSVIFAPTLAGGTSGTWNITINK